MYYTAGLDGRRILRRPNLYTTTYPEGVAYGSFCLDSGTVAVAKVASRCHPPFSKFRPQNDTHTHILLTCMFCHRSRFVCP